MNYKEWRCKDINLLKKKQAIFGEDLVVDAYVIFSAHEEERYKKLKYHLQKAPELEDENDCIKYDSDTIRFVFSNGRSVDFWNSEWAGICITDKTNEEELILKEE